jgi:hypothetical protein
MIYWFGMWAIKPMDIKSWPVEEKIFIPIVNSAVFLVSQKKRYDTFGVGHSSTSISAALGMAIASNLKVQQTPHCYHWWRIYRFRYGFWRLNHAGVTDANTRNSKWYTLLDWSSVGLETIPHCSKRGKTQGKTTWLSPWILIIRDPLTVMIFFWSKN